MPTCLAILTHDPNNKVNLFKNKQDLFKTHYLKIEKARLLAVPLI